MNYICTSFFHVDEVAPNIGAVQTNKKFETYYKCIIVMFTSAKTFTDAKLQLFTDKCLPKDFQEKLDTLGVETIILENKVYVYSFKNNFPGCLFLLDAFNSVINDRKYSNSDKFLFVDSDCIFTKKIDFDRNCIAYDLKKGINENVNGQTRASLLNLKNLIYASNDVVESLKFYGGEFYLFSIESIRKLSNQISKIVSEIQSLHGQDFVLTEEHLISIALTQLKTDSQNKDITRIWTTRSYNNVDKSDLNVAIYHMPSEKKELFVKLYNRLFSNLSQQEREKIFSRDVYEYIVNKPRPNFFMKIYRYLKTVIGAK